MFEEFDRPFRQNSLRKSELSCRTKEAPNVLRHTDRVRVYHKRSGEGVLEQMQDFDSIRALVDNAEACTAPRDIHSPEFHSLDIVPVNYPDRNRRKSQNADKENVVLPTMSSNFCSFSEVDYDCEILKDCFLDGSQNHVDVNPYHADNNPHHLTPADVLTSFDPLQPVQPKKRRRSSLHDPILRQRQYRELEGGNLSKTGKEPKLMHLSEEVKEAKDFLCSIWKGLKLKNSDLPQVENELEEYLNLREKKVKGMFSIPKKPKKTIK